MIKTLRQRLFKFYRHHLSTSHLLKDIEELKILVAKESMGREEWGMRVGALRDVEFKVFSQYGDDGIIQYLIRQVKVGDKSFVEFGVEDYVESNTRFLLINDNWRGLVMDGDSTNVRYIRKDEVSWRYDLTAVQAFVSRENINRILTEQGFIGDIGLLSIDIDGNDYWVWEAIDVARPSIVIVEYNSTFGAKRAVTIPYDPSFYRMKAHYSGVYWGSSLKALVMLGERKGYGFIGCNSAGNNAYFIRSDRLGKLRRTTALKGYVEARFRESRDRNGRLTFLPTNERLALIQELPVVDVETNSTVRIKELME